MTLDLIARGQLIHELVLLRHETDARFRGAGQPVALVAEHLDAAAASAA